MEVQVIENAAEGLDLARVLALGPLHRQVRVRVIVPNRPPISRLTMEAHSGVTVVGQSMVVLVRVHVLRTTLQVGSWNSIWTSPVPKTM